MLGFSTAAWKLAPRDNFIGWTPEKLEKNLQLVVDKAIDHIQHRSALMRVSQAHRVVPAPLPAIDDEFAAVVGVVRAQPHRRFLRQTRRHVVELPAPALPATLSCPDAAARSPTESR